MNKLCTSLLAASKSEKPKSSELLSLSVRLRVFDPLLKIGGVVARTDIKAGTGTEVLLSV